MNALAYLVVVTLWIITIIAMLAHVFRTERAEAAVFALVCFPYAVRQTFRVGKYKRWTVAAFWAAVVATIAWIGIAISTSGDPGAGLSTGGGSFTALGWALLAGILVDALMYFVGSTWLAMNAFDREGLLPGLLTVMLWPYAVYYGISRFRVNRAPALLCLIPVVTGASFTALLVLLRAQY